MGKLIDGFINFILIILAIIVIAATTYFCLDVFGIIEVPTKYSIANLLYSQIEVIAVGEVPVNDNTVPENKVKKRVPADDTSETVIEGVDGENGNSREDALERLKALQEEQQSSQTTETPRYEYVSSDSSRLYYDQLDTYGKKIYDKLYANKDELRTGNYTADFDKEFNDLLHEEDGTETLNNSFQLAINALTFDNPEFFYIDITKIYLLTEITTRAFSKTYRVTIGSNGSNYLFDEFRYNDSVYDAISRTEEVRNKLIEELSDKSTFEKIKGVHDYLVSNLEYDSEAGNNIYSIYGALIDGRCVCEGYAKSFKYILDELDVPCIIACGVGTNSAGTTESHAWNYVLIDDKWYAVDCTWDDPIIVGGIMIGNKINYTYFLKGSDLLFRDHFEDGNLVGTFNFKYPTISKEDYE